MLTWNFLSDCGLFHNLCLGGEGRRGHQRWGGPLFWELPPPLRESAGGQCLPPEGATAHTWGLPSQDTHTLPRPGVDKTFTNSVRGKKKWSFILPRCKA